MSELTVRQARAALASSLLDERRHEEATRQLRKAMTESGSIPPEWELHRQVGIVEADRGDHTSALKAVLAAVRTAPADEAGTPAHDAIRLLRRDDSSLLAASVPSRDVSELLDGQASRPSEVIKLAARLAYLRGEITSSAQHPTRVAPEASDESLAAAELVAKAYRVLEESGPDEALGVFEQASVMFDGPILSALALVQYASGRIDEAESTLLEAPDTFDAAVTSALVSLRTASMVGVGNREDANRRAADAASLAARLDPGHGDALLLRSEVMLETGADLGEGRHLLSSALRKFDRGEQPVWWRVQERVRDDDEFLYFLMEMASARHDHQRVLDLDGRILRSTTEYRIDAAIHELAADALRQLGQPEPAAARFREAAAQFDWVGDLDRALEMTEAAQRLAPLVRDQLSIANVRWRRSFLGDESFAHEEIAAGIAALQPPSSDEDDAIVVEACYLHGLLDARATDFLSVIRTARRPLPRLLVAALSSPTDAYRSMHLARRLDRAGMPRTALRFADHALRLGPPDDFIREGVVIVHFNWAGTLDAEAESLLDGLPDDFDSWRNSFRVYSGALSSDPGGVERLLAVEPFDAPWAALAHGMAAARIGAVDQSLELLTSLARDWKRLGTEGEAVDAALALGQPDEAARALNVAAPSMSQRRMRYNTGLIDIARGDASANAVVDLLAERSRPFDQHELVHLNGPVFADANPKGRDEFLDAVAAVAEMIRAAPADRSLAADLLDDEWAVDIDETDSAINALVEITTLVDRHELGDAVRLAETFASHELAREFEVLARSLSEVSEWPAGNGFAGS